MATACGRAMAVARWMSAGVRRFGRRGAAWWSSQRKTVLLVKQFVPSLRLHGTPVRATSPSCQDSVEGEWRGRGYGMGREFTAIFRFWLAVEYGLDKPSD